MTLHCGDWPGAATVKCMIVFSLRKGLGKASGYKIPANTPLAKPRAVEKGHLVLVCTGTLWTRYGEVAPRT